MANVKKSILKKAVGKAKKSEMPMMPKAEMCPCGMKGCTCPKGKCDCK